MDIFGFYPTVGCYVDIGPAPGPRGPGSGTVFSVRFVSQQESWDTCGNEGAA